MIRMIAVVDGISLPSTLAAKVRVEGEGEGEGLVDINPKLNS